MLFRSDENTAKEIFAELGYADEIENEELAVVGGDYEVYSIDGCDDDFCIVSKDQEHRCIAESAIVKIFEDEAENVYDDEQWREEVANGGITEGYDEWFNDIVNNADYGSFFASYDGGEEMCGNYYMFRVN